MSTATGCDALTRHHSSNQTDLVPAAKGTISVSERGLVLYIQKVHTDMAGYSGFVRSLLKNAQLTHGSGKVSIVLWPESSTDRIEIIEKLGSERDLESSLYRIQSGRGTPDTQAFAAGLTACAKLASDGSKVILIVANGQTPGPFDSYDKHEVKANTDIMKNVALSHLLHVIVFAGAPKQYEAYVSGYTVSVTPGDVSHAQQLKD